MESFQVIRECPLVHMYSPCMTMRLVPKANHSPQLSAQKSGELPPLLLPPSLLAIPCCALSYSMISRDQYRDGKNLCACTCRMEVSTYSPNSLIPSPKHLQPLRHTSTSGSSSLLSNMFKSYLRHFRPMLPIRAHAPNHQADPHDHSSHDCCVTLPVAGLGVPASGGGPDVFGVAAIRLARGFWVVADGRRIVVGSREDERDLAAA